MKKINWKIFNIALWTEILLSYILPFRVVDAFQCKVGFPIPFLSVYNTKLGVSPLTSMLFNPLGLFFNVILIYWMICLVIKARNWMHKKERKD